MDLVLLFQTAKDGDGLLDRRLSHQHRLETALQGRVLLDVLPVLGERRRTDATQLAAGEGRFQEVGCVHRALGGAGTDQRVDLVDEQNNLAVGVHDLFDHRLETVLELAAVLGAGDQGSEVEGDDAPVLQQLGDVAFRDALRQPLRDCRLADARLTDQNGVVLGPASQDLHHPADLVVAADDRIQLAGTGQLGQVARVLLQGLELLLGIGIRHTVGAANFLDRSQQRVAIDAMPHEDLACRPRHARNGEQQVLDRHVLILELGRELARGLKDISQVTRRLRLGRAPCRRQPVHRRREVVAHTGNGSADLLEQLRRKPVSLHKEGLQQVDGSCLGVAPPGSQLEGSLERFPGLDGEVVVGSHVSHLVSGPCPSWTPARVES